VGCKTSVSCWWHVSGVVCCRSVSGSVMACGQNGRSRCMPQFENSVSFELPESPSPQICISVVVNNVLQVNMTSQLWCEYILNIGQYRGRLLLCELCLTCSCTFSHECCKKPDIAVRNKPRHYGNSHAIWDHTVLPATRQK